MLHTPLAGQPPFRLEEDFIKAKDLLNIQDAYLRFARERGYYTVDVTGKTPGDVVGVIKTALEAARLGKELPSNLNKAL